MDESALDSQSKTPPAGWPAVGKAKANAAA
jgi:hypothetical protein